MTLLGTQAARHLRLPAVALGFALVCGAQAGGACPGPAPPPGSRIRGPVLLVPDRETLCVAAGSAPQTWRAVRLPQPAASRSRLMAAAFSKTAVCEVGPGHVAACIIEGEPLQSLLDRQGAGSTPVSWR